MRVRERLRRLLPTREQLQANRWLRWLGPWLNQPALWRWSRRGVALGVALGVFFGLLVPIAQIPLSAAAAVVLRANVPAAAVSTLVTNPVTFAPIYYVAYRIGHGLTGDLDPPAESGEEVLPELPKEASAWERIGAMGKPLLLGLVIMATLTGIVCYGAISLFWRWRTLRRRKQGKLLRRQPNQNPH